jgi:hypothetical protein
VWCGRRRAVWVQAGGNDRRLGCGPGGGRSVVSAVRMRTVGGDLL